MTAIPRTVGELQALVLIHRHLPATQVQMSLLLSTGPTHGQCFWPKNDITINDSSSYHLVIADNLLGGGMRGGNYQAEHISLSNIKIPCNIPVTTDIDDSVESVGFTADYSTDTAV